VSRFQAKLDNGRTIAWGYDNQLAEYFMQEYYSEEELNKMTKKELERTDEVVFSVSSHTTLTPHPKYPKKMDWSNNDLLQLMRKYPEIPRIHKQAIAADLPF
jgi:hypothetical protein